MMTGMRTISFQPPTSAPKLGPLADVNEELETTSPIDPALVLAGLPHSARDFSSSSARSQAFGESPRPSSAHSRQESASSSAPGSATMQSARMLPPFHVNTPTSMGSPGERAPSIPEHRDKRARPSPTVGQFSSQSSDYMSPRSQTFTPSGTSDPYYQSKGGTGTGKTTPGSASNPALTPPASVNKSEEPLPNPLVRSSAYLADDVRRLSVNSLLTQEEESKNREGSSLDQTASLFTFGIDRGQPDLDIPKNDDSRALEVVTPPSDATGFSNDFTELSSEFGFGIQGNGGVEKKAGYSEPISVTISKTLLPLPSLLLDNQMNLMYFHFFQEFTARILVPHDCPDNPFIKILPQSKWFLKCLYYC
jgi:hypothetical protein